MNLFVSQVTEPTMTKLCDRVWYFFFLYTNQSDTNNSTGSCDVGASLSHLRPDLHHAQKHMNLSAPSRKVCHTLHPKAISAFLKFHSEMRFLAFGNYISPTKYWHECKTHYGNTLKLLTIHGFCLQTRRQLPGRVWAFKIKDWWSVLLS